MWGSKVRIDKGLLEKATRYAQVAGYSSAEEFINHVVEKELAQLEDADSEEEINRFVERQGLTSP